MATLDGFHFSRAFLAALLAGGVNPVVGGGAMILLPVPGALGLPPVIAPVFSAVHAGAGGALQ
jgi:hypothetical protein